VVVEGVKKKKKKQKHTVQRYKAEPELEPVPKQQPRAVQPSSEREQ
jgi:hypothetical protein